MSQAMSPDVPAGTGFRRGRLVRVTRRDDYDAAASLRYLGITL